MNNWTNRDWKWVAGILIGTILLIATAWLSNITDVSNYFSFLGTGISIVLALVAIYISLSQNNNAQLLNTKTTEMLIRIEERVGNVNEKVDKFDSNKIARTVETGVRNVIEDYSKTIFNTLEKVGIDQEKIESVKAAVPVAKVLIQKIAKISITTSVLSYSDTTEGSIGFATYEVYDQYGNVITTGSHLNDNLTFKSQFGNATGKNGLITVIYLKNAYLASIGTDIMTITDTTTGVSTSCPLSFVYNSK